MAAVEEETEGRNEEDDVDEDDEDVTVLSVNLSGGRRLGAALYSASSAALAILDDIVDADFRLCASLVAQIAPSVVIASANADADFLASLRMTCGVPTSPLSSTGATSAEAQDSALRETLLETLPASEFALESCKRRLLQLRLPQEDPNTSEEAHFVFLNGVINLQGKNASCVRAAGAVLKYVDRRNVLGRDLDGNGQNSTVLTIRPLIIEDVLTVDEATFAALQIFHSPDKMSASKAGSWNRQREGLSVFNTLNRCKSILGSNYMRHLCRCPLANMAAILERQEAVAYFAHPKQIEMVAALKKQIKDVKNVPKILRIVSTTQIGVKEWKALRKSVLSLVQICNICRMSQGRGIRIIEQMASTASEELKYVTNLLETVMDTEMTTKRGRFTAKSGVDVRLDEMRHLQDGLPDLLSRVVDEEILTLPNYITKATMVYVPQVGYLLAVQPWLSESTEKGDSRATQDVKEAFENVPGAQLMFCANGVPHYKTKACAELDDSLGDTASAIAEQETFVMINLIRLILAHTENILLPSRFCSLLDCILSMAEVASVNNWCRPNIKRDGTFDIDGGRHMLQEQCTENFVSNATRLGGSDKPKIMILTGPNASGKSVHLKQVGLITYLAHMGCFVPAQKAEIPLVDRIHSRLLTVDSLHLGLSAFAVDLNQMALAFSSVTSRSLLLLDEFGKGTRQPDGEALLAASIEWLSKLDETSQPFVIVSTHFQRIKAVLDFRVTPATIAYFTFDIMQQNEELVFLYKLIEGFSGRSSKALETAKRAGLSQSLIKRSEAILETVLSKGGKPLEPRKDVLKVEKALDVANTFFSLDLANDDSLQEFLKNLRED